MYINTKAYNMCITIMNKQLYLHIEKEINILSSYMFNTTGLISQGPPILIFMWTWILI